MNMVSLDPDGSTNGPTDTIGKVRVANGQFMVLDRNGTQIPIVLPTNLSGTAPAPTPFAFLPTFQGNSVLGSVVISDPSAMAQHMGANVQFTATTTGECPHRLDPCKRTIGSRL